jgi:hypothetical protein
MRPAAMLPADRTDFSASDALRQKWSREQVEARLAHSSAQV